MQAQITLCVGYPLWPFSRRLVVQELSSSWELPGARQAMAQLSAEELQQVSTCPNK